MPRSHATRPCLRRLALAPDTVMATITPAERPTTFRHLVCLKLCVRGRLSQAPLMALSYPLLRCMSRPEFQALLTDNVTCAIIGFIASRGLWNAEHAWGWYRANERLKLCAIILTPR